MSDCPFLRFFTVPFFSRRIVPPLPPHSLHCIANKLTDTYSSSRDRLDFIRLYIWLLFRGASDRRDIVIDASNSRGRSSDFGKLLTFGAFCGWSEAVDVDAVRVRNWLAMLKFRLARNFLHYLAVDRRASDVSNLCLDPRPPGGASGGRKRLSVL